MPGTARRVLGAVVAALGTALVVVGVWPAFTLGPSGEASFSVTSKAPGAIVVGPEVLNSVDVPVRVTAARRDGGPVRLAVAPASDARAILARSAVSVVSGVNYPAGSLDLRSSGAGSLRDPSTADVWRLSAKGEGSAELVVGQDRAPETAVLTSGDDAALKDVTLTLTWANRAWFIEALAVAMLGAIVAAFALNDLWQGLSVASRTRALGIRVTGTNEPGTKAEVTT